MTVNKLGQYKIPCYWYQNIQDPNRPFISLTATYDPKLYPAYDNYDAINVYDSRKIPNDYYGVMGVSVGILIKHNPQQFEIVGEANNGSDGPLDLFKPFVNGKQKYKRLLIRRKQ